MEVRIDLKKLDARGISLSQFLFMLTIYHNATIRDSIELTPEAKMDLIFKKYITQKGEKYSLTAKSMPLFESNPELFNLFIETFPTRVTNEQGVIRVLSPASADTIAATKLKSKWYTLTSTNTELKNKILECFKSRNYS